ncbi:MAG: AzlC family ABC transporter permease [Eubacteriaceae bacterium]|jgi:predicted branched-subunit amino acid permease
MQEDSYSLRLEGNRNIFRQGMRDGIPIGLGYLAVSFSLGITAKNAGLNPFQSFLASLLCNASAGEYAGFTLIAAGATYVEMAVMTFIVNARYLLMSLAMSQRIKPGTSWIHRLVMSLDITDELFAIAISRPGYLNPNYTYGAVLVAAPFWAVGTALGCIAGELMPLRLVSAFSVALFGMFLAVIVPPARKNKVIAGLIAVCFAASWAATYLPGISSISSGTRTIILTVVISAAVAILFPKDDVEEALEESEEEIRE